MTAPAVLSVAIEHRFPGFELDVAFDAPAGVTALFGASGAGKTTIVNAVAGLLQPVSGTIRLGDRVLLDTARGQSVEVHKRKVGYVFQDGRLFPHMSVRANLAYGQPASGTRERHDQVVALLGLEALVDRRIGDLSGGEKQRVAIGRALLAQPDLLLMDEPLAALDPVRKEAIIPYLERLRGQAGLPILYVSHSLDEIARLADKIVVLKDGKILGQGPTDDVLADPKLVPAFGVRDAGALLRARVTAHHSDGLTELATSNGTLLLPGIEAAPGDVLRIRIAAKDVILAAVRPEGLSALNILPVTVTDLQSGTGPGTGSGSVVQVTAGQDKLLARVTNRSVAALNIAPGREMFAVIKSVSVAPSAVGRG